MTAASPPGTQVGDGVRWSADARVALLVRDGVAVRKISTADATHIAATIGVDVPSGAEIQQGMPTDCPLTRHSHLEVGRLTRHSHLEA